MAGIVQRVVAECLPDARLTRLRAIGVDEFSYRERPRDLAVVVDHDRGEAVWAAIESVTRDMAAVFKNTLRDHLPHPGPDRGQPLPCPAA